MAQHRIVHRELGMPPALELKEQLSTSSADTVVTYHLLCVGHVFKGSVVEIITFLAAHCS